MSLLRVVELMLLEFIFKGGSRILSSRFVFRFYLFFSIFFKYWFFLVIF